MRQENLHTKSVNIKLKQDLDKVKIKREALEIQMTNMKSKLDDKEEAVNTANAKIISLEENKTIIEDKLNSYGATLRQLIKEKGEGKKENKVEDKGNQKLQMPWGWGRSDTSDVASLGYLLSLTRQSFD